MKYSHYAIDVAAAATGTTVEQIQRWIRDGHITAITHNGTIYVSAESVRQAPEAAKRHGYTKLARKLTTDLP